MKTSKLLALASIFGGLNASAQDPATINEILAATEVGSSLPPIVAPGLIEGVATAKSIFKNFGVKKISNGSYILTGTIPNKCVPFIKINSTDSQGKEGFAGGWEIESVDGKAQACVAEFHKTEKCSIGNCKSLSEISSKFTLTDISTEGLSTEQIKALPELKIGLFWKNYEADVSSPEFVQAESIDDSVTFTSLAKEAVIAQEKAEAEKAEKIEAYQTSISECLTKNEGFGDAKDAVSQLQKLGKLTQVEAKKELAKIEDAEFEADLAAATTAALTDRETHIKKLNSWIARRPKDADRIARARVEIARRLVSGTEITEADDVAGVTRADNDEAYRILTNTGRIRGISKSMSQEISQEISALNQKVIYEYANSGEMTSGDLAKVLLPLEAKMARVCSQQMRMYLDSMNPNRMNQRMGFGIQFNAYSGLNNGMMNHGQINDSECMALNQTKQQYVQLKMNSDQVKQNRIFAAQNPGYQSNGAIIPAGYQQVTSNYFTQPGAVQQNTGMWNTTPGIQQPVMGPTNVFNPGAMMYGVGPSFNPTSQYYNYNSMYLGS